MPYSKLTIGSRSKLKRFSHSRRFRTAVTLIGPSAGDRILDYGTGDGYLLTLLHNASPETTIVGYEPVPAMYSELVAQLASTPGVEAVQNLTCGLTPFNKIACLEVLEHLQDKDIELALSNMRALLATEGAVVVSVPLEIGPSAVLKNIIRIALGQAEEDTSFSNLLRSLFGAKVSRKLYGDTYGHMGFDYRKLEYMFHKAGFQIKYKSFSPFPMLRSIINSQVLYVLKG